MEYVNGIVRIVRNAGMATRGSSQSIRAALATISAPDQD